MTPEIPTPTQPPEQLQPAVDLALETFLQKWKFSEQNEKTIRQLPRLASLAEQGFLDPPLPPGFGKQLGDRAKELLEKSTLAWGFVRSFLAREPTPDVRDGIEKEMQEYRSALEAYKKFRSVELIRTTALVGEKVQVPRGDINTLSDILEGHHPMRPPGGAASELVEMFRAVEKKFIALYGQMDAVAEGLPTPPGFLRDLHEYQVDMYTYKERCFDMVAPRFGKKILESVNKGADAKDQLSFSGDDWKGLLHEVSRPLAPPGLDGKHDTETESYLRAQYDEVTQMQNFIVQSLNGIQTDLWKGRQVSPERCKEFLGAMVVFLLRRDDYENLACRIPEQQNETHRLLHLAFFGVGLQAAQTISHTMFPKEKKPFSVPPEREKAFRAQYDAMKEKFVEKGIPEADLPSYRALMETMEGSFWKEFVNGFKDLLNPIDYILFAFILYFSRDKTKASMEFLGCVFALQVSSIPIAIIERWCWKQALAGDVMMLRVLRSPMPAMAKFAIAIGVMFGLGKLIDTVSEKVSDWIPAGPFKTFMEGVLNTLGLGPVFDIAGWGYREAFGVYPDEENASLEYLSGKTGITPTLQRSISDWNRLVDRGISLDPGAAKLYALEKIDVPQNGDMRQSAWVRRQAAQTFAQASQLLQEEYRFAEAIKKRHAEKQGSFGNFDPNSIPRLAANMLDSTLPMDDTVTLDQRLLRARDNAFDTQIDNSLTMNNADRARLQRLSQEVSSFQKFMDACNDTEIQEFWKRLTNMACQLGSRVSVYRHLGIYDEQTWMGGQENIRGEFKQTEYMREGLLEQAAYRMRLSKAESKEMQMKRMVSKINAQEKIEISEWLEEQVQRFKKGIDLRPSNITGYTSPDQGYQELMHLQNVSKDALRLLPETYHTLIFDGLAQLKVKQKCPLDDIRRQREILQNAIHAHFGGKNGGPPKSTIDYKFVPSSCAAVVQGVRLGEYDSDDRTQDGRQPVQSRKRVFDGLWNDESSYVGRSLAFFQETGNDGNYHRRMLFSMPTEDRRSWSVHVAMKQTYFYLNGKQEGSMIVTNQSEEIPYDRWSLRYPEIDRLLQTFFKDKENTILGEKAKKQEEKERTDREVARLMLDALKNKQERMNKVKIGFTPLLLADAGLRAKVFARLVRDPNVPKEVIALLTQRNDNIMPSAMAALHKEQRKESLRQYSKTVQEWMEYFLQNQSYPDGMTKEKPTDEMVRAYLWMSQCLVAPDGTIVPPDFFRKPDSKAGEENQKGEMRKFLEMQAEPIVDREAQAEAKKVVEWLQLIEKAKTTKDRFTFVPDRPDSKKGNYIMRWKDRKDGQEYIIATGVSPYDRNRDSDETKLTEGKNHDPDPDRGHGFAFHVYTLDVDLTQANYWQNAPTVMGWWVPTVDAWRTLDDMPKRIALAVVTTPLDDDFNQSLWRLLNWHAYRVEGGGLGYTGDINYKHVLHDKLLALYPYIEDRKRFLEVIADQLNISDEKTVEDIGKYLRANYRSSGLALKPGGGSRFVDEYIMDIFRDPSRSPRPLSFQGGGPTNAQIGPAR